MDNDMEKYQHLYKGVTDEGHIFLSREIEEGNIEYKRQLVAPTPERLVKLTSQLKWRLFEGHGEAFYQLGVDDDGSPFGLSELGLEKSIANLRTMAQALNAKVIVVCKRPGNNGYIAEVLVREIKHDVCDELRIAVIGDADSGKSTLIGVLTTGQLDNGRGFARVSCFNHQHEVLTGRTSSIAYQLMGFNVDGECVNDQSLFKSWGDIIEDSYKVISFIDLAGHEKYFSLTVEGITGNLPDYCFLLVSAATGITNVTKDHFRIALSMKIPVIVIVTKMDMVKETKYNRTLNAVKRLITSVKKKPFILGDSDDVCTVVKEIQENQTFPIISVSNVTGENLDLLKSLLNAIPPSIMWDSVKNDVETQVVVAKIFRVEGVGIVLGGVVLSGCLTINSNVILGPDDQGKYISLTVKNIQINRVSVSEANAGRCASIAFNESEILVNVRKGMFLLSEECEPLAVRSFQAQVAITHHPTSIKIGYEPVVQCMMIKQVAKITEINNLREIRTGDKATVTFTFKYRPEYIKVGMRIFFKEGIGYVTNISEVEESVMTVSQPISLRTSRDDIMRSPSFRVRKYVEMSSSF
jgi:GTPase